MLRGYTGRESGLKALPHSGLKALPHSGLKALPNEPGLYSAGASFSATMPSTIAPMIV